MSKASFEVPIVRKGWLHLWLEYNNRDDDKISKKAKNLGAKGAFGNTATVRASNKIEVPESLSKRTQGTPPSPTQ
jgi:hypothetical protein